MPLVPSLSKQLRAGELRASRDASVADVALKPHGGVGSRVSTLADTLLAICSNYPEHCNKARKWRDRPASIRDDFKLATKRHLEQYSVSMLSGAVSAWRRYRSFLTRLPPPSPQPFPASPAVVSVFLDFVGRGDKRTASTSKAGNIRGGGCAVNGVRAGLAFLSVHLELPFPMSDTDVKHAGNDAIVNARGQAPPAAPWDLRALGELAEAQNQIASFFGLGVIAILRAGIRYEHSTRSQLVGFDGKGAWFLCAAGKSRKNGKKSPAYRFFVPEVQHPNGPFPMGCVSTFCRRLEKAFGKKATWMLPALWPASASVSSAKKLVAGPMSLGSFNTNLWAVSVFGISTHGKPECLETVRK